MDQQRRLNIQTKTGPLLSMVGTMKEHFPLTQEFLCEGLKEIVDHSESARFLKQLETLVKATAELEAKNDARTKTLTRLRTEEFDQQDGLYATFKELYNQEFTRDETRWTEFRKNLWQIEHPDEPFEDEDIMMTTQVETFTCPLAVCLLMFVLG